MIESSDIILPPNVITGYVQVINNCKNYVLDLI